MSPLLLSLLSLLAVTSSVSGATPCHICGDRGNGAMSFPNVILSNVGKSCTQISLEVAVSVPVGSAQCTAKQNEWNARCCTTTRPAGRDQADGGLPNQNVPAVTYVGPHPPCHVCRDGDYPFATSMVINFLYIGEGSCAQYYRYGLEGRIQQHMCDPVKFFSYEPCGCGEFNPYFNANHPLNQQAQQAPGQNGNGNGNSNGNNNGGGGQSTQPQQQRQPDSSEGKGCVKMSNSYGGSGGVGCGGQRLLGSSSGVRGVKGSKKTPTSTEYDSIAVVQDVLPQATIEVDQEVEAEVQA